MNLHIRNGIIALLMLASSVGAMTLRPSHRIVDEGSAVNLETMLPKQFGDWQEEPQHSGQVINPQQQEMLDRIYTQLLSRTYINSKGERIMLSIAYGADQSDAKQLHYPEVCYPAQGFQVISSSTGVVNTDFGDIRVKRILTVMGNRSEPLTYWSTVGNKVVVGNKETKLEQLRYGFRGQIPDGLLFRISSITSDVEAGYASQQSFTQDLIATLPERDRLKLAGLGKNNIPHQQP
jgi:EpsI family protein